jgi:hypothetical protein
MVRPSLVLDPSRGPRTTDQGPQDGPRTKYKEPRTKYYVRGGYTPCSAMQKYSVRYGCMLLCG